VGWLQKLLSGLNFAAIRSMEPPKARKIVKIYGVAATFSLQFLKPGKRLDLGPEARAIDTSDWCFR
jgi:hypothetical protein